MRKNENSMMPTSSHAPEEAPNREGSTIAGIDATPHADDARASRLRCARSEKNELAAM